MEIRSRGNDFLTREVLWHVCLLMRMVLQRRRNKDVGERRLTAGQNYWGEKKRKT